VPGSLLHSLSLPTDQALVGFALAKGVFGGQAQFRQGVNTRVNDEAVALLERARHCEKAKQVEAQRSKTRGAHTQASPSIGLAGAATKR